MIIKRIISVIAAAMLIIPQTFTTYAEENVIHLYEGEAYADEWSCPLTIPVPDTSIYAEGNSIAIRCDCDDAPYFVLTSNSGGENWASLLPDDVNGDTYYYSYDAMTDVFGTDFSLLDYISVMAANSPVTVYSIDMVMGGVPQNPEDENREHISRVVGYLPDWSYQVYGKLDFSALTHMNIAFCNPDSNGNLSCYIPDIEMKNIVNKAHSNGVKVMAALGGAGGCDAYLPLLDTPEEMADFNEKIIAYCEKYDLDGIDLDIELGSSNEIWNYYADWVSSLRVICDEYGYEMSTATAQWVAVKVSPETFGLFDFINVMAYDNDADDSSHCDMDFTQTSLKYFNIQKKIPKDKLVLGVPFYGRGYTADGKLDWNSYVPFSELIELDKGNYNKDLYGDIAFNGAVTMAEKCDIAKDYGGIMIWELSQDAAGEYSLLAVIKDKLSVAAEVTGDVNADGEFSIADAVMLQGWLLGNGELTDWQSGDLCKDGTIDVFDFCRMREMLVA
ncbi:MAG: hypothetical protein IKV85_03530 [Ruminococcus sp.]|nr:hypothetical protein [Ruminococcus sp.]